MADPVQQKRPRDDGDDVDFCLHPPSHAQHAARALCAMFNQQTLYSYLLVLKQYFAASGSNKKIHTSGSKTQMAGSIVAVGNFDETLKILAYSKSRGSMTHNDLVDFVRDLWHRYKDSNGILQKKMPVQYPLKGDTIPQLLTLVDQLKNIQWGVVPYSASDAMGKVGPIQPAKPAKPAADIPAKRQSVPMPQTSPHTSPPMLLTAEEQLCQQGKFGTCAAFALATTVARILLWKFEFAIDAKGFAEQLKILLPCWRGADLARMIEFWNKLDPDQACVENLQKDTRINFKLGYTKNDCFKESHKRLETLHKMNLPLLVSMNIGASQTSHAVVAILPWVYQCPSGFKLPRIVAINSWGSDNPLPYVKGDNFNYAIEVHVEISRAVDGNGKAKTIAVAQHMQALMQMHT